MSALPTAAGASPRPTGLICYAGKQDLSARLWDVAERRPLRSLRECPCGTRDNGAIYPYTWQNKSCVTQRQILMILPLMVLGRLSLNSTIRGYLYGAVCCLT